METTSYAAKAAVIDDLIAANPDLPTPTTVDLGASGTIWIHVDGWAEVFAWARAMRVTPVVYPTSDSRRVQAEIRATLIHGLRVTILGATLCAEAGLEHLHDECVDEVRAEASLLDTALALGAPISAAWIYTCDATERLSGVTYPTEQAARGARDRHIGGGAGEPPCLGGHMVKLVSNALAIGSAS